MLYYVAFCLDCRNDVIAPPSDITWPCEDPRRLRDLLEFRRAEYLTSDTTCSVDDAERDPDGGCVVVPWVFYMYLFVFDTPFIHDFVCGRQSYLHLIHNLFLLYF